MMDNLAQTEEIEALDAIYGSDFRREAGSDVTYSIEVIPNVRLYLTLNDAYPSNAPPTYQLLAPCLSKEEKQRITNIFDEIYLENIGGPVLYQWIEKLKEVVQLDENIIIENQIENPNTSEDINITINYNIIHGPLIQDRKSTFQGHVCEINSEIDVKNVLAVLMENKKIAQATHNIYAYRIEKSPAILQDCNDDGETQAGGRLLHLLDILKVKNVMVVVSRWYGGIHLGPDRFRHINNAAREVLQLGGFIK